MADEPRTIAKENLEQIHRDTERDARVEPGPGKTTNEADMQRAEGLQADPKVAENYVEGLEEGTSLKDEGRALDR